MRTAPASTGEGPSSARGRQAQGAVDRMLDVVPWYNGLPAPERAEIRAGLRLVSLRKGEYLFRMGARSPGWYGVVDGLVKWSSPGIDGKTLSLAGFSTGSWFGEATMLRAAPFDYEVVALRQSRVVILPRDICERLWNHNIAFTQALMMHLAQRVDWLMASYSGNVLLDVDTMVARAVAAQLAAESHSGTNGRLKISQEEIASLCGVSRQRCNAALTRLARDGVLQTRYGGLTILDSEALHEHAKLKGDAAPEREPDA
ncbi:Crp/Fnr family transcriptional regulator [Achromobacter xylosoxidans]